MGLSQIQAIAPKWKAAAACLGLLTLAPVFVSGGAASGFRLLLLAGTVGLGAVWFVSLRRAGASQAGSAPLRILARSSLGVRTGVAVVEFEGRRWLIGYGEDFANVLASPSRTKRRSSGSGACS